MGSAIGMDKWRTKMIWLNAGIPTPRYRILEAGDDWNAVAQDLGLPLIVKPAREGSTLGLTKVSRRWSNCPPPGTWLRASIPRYRPGRGIHCRRRVHRQRAWAIGCCR